MVTIMKISGGVGGVFGCLYGGLMTEYVSPLWCWFGYAFLGLLCSFFACMLSPAAEEDQEVVLGDSDMSTSEEEWGSRYRITLEIGGMTREEAREYEVPVRDGFGFNLRKNCQAIGRAVIMREIF